MALPLALLITTLVVQTVFSQQDIPFCLVSILFLTTVQYVANTTKANLSDSGRNQSLRYPCSSRLDTLPGPDLCQPSGYSESHCQPRCRLLSGESFLERSRIPIKY
jgi:hypothetical protein